MKIIVLLVITLVSSMGCSNQNSTNSNRKKQPVDYVNVFMGTGGHGHTYPGATVPFGMVQVSPDNGKGGWDYSSGYNYRANHITGFSMTHLSGTGIGDLYDLSFMPFSGSKVDTSDGGLTRSFSHENEIGSPGYYHVTLDNGIGIDLTATQRVGFYRYEFSDKKNPAVSLDLGFELNGDHTTKSNIKVVSDTLVVGYRFSSGWANDQRVYFAASFSRPIADFEGTQDGSKIKNGSQLKGKKTHGFFFFAQDTDSLLQKVAISAVSIENAKMNLNHEAPGWNFEHTRRSARRDWNAQLSKIDVQSPDTSKLSTFYSSLYHTMLGPTLYMDANGEYRGADKKVHTAKGFKAYSTFSLWDTYRAEHPLLTFTQPDRVNGMIKFMLAFYDQHGLLPVWELKANETNTMIGYHAIPVIADAYFKGFHGFDVEKAYEAMKKSATEENQAVKLFNKYGYVPSDKVTESVSKTLAFAYDDWCIAQMGKALGHEQDYKKYSKRAGYWRNQYSKSSGFMHPKTSSGAWEEPFEPLHEPSDFSKRDFTEANAWQILWYVPQDMSGFITAMGGQQKFVGRLDTLFTMSSHVKGGVPDMSGMIGQYVQGNEPDQQVAYLYDYGGAPWKTQQRVRAIVDSLYHPGPDGIPGNEDVGQMSAWYVFSALGFYPVNPANGVYAIGSPSFPEATLHLQHGKSFTVKANNASTNNIYIQSANLDGKPYDKPYITYQDIMASDTLALKMGATPNKQWGASQQNRPPEIGFEMN